MVITELQRKLLESSTERYVLQMHAQILSPKEECVLGMEQRPSIAVAKDAQIMLSVEECALDMEQRSNDASVKDAQIKFRKVECA